MGFRPTTPLAIVGVAILYFLSARLGLLIAFENTNATAVWPPSGIAVASLLILGYRVAPGIWMGAFAANLLGFIDSGSGDISTFILISATIASGNLVEGLVAKYLLSKVLKAKKSFSKYQHVFLFLLIGIPAALVSSSVGVASLFWAGIINSSTLFFTWQIWLLGDISGIVILVPLLLFIADRKKDDQSFSRAEFWLNLLILICVSWYIFISHQAGEDIRLKAYFLIPFFMWAAFRFTQLEMSALLVSVSGVIIAGTVNGTGPFAGDDLNQSLLELQSFTTLICISFLALAATLFDQKKIRHRMEESQGKLEQRIMERTQALTTKIGELEKTEKDLAIIKQEFVKACDIAHLGHFQWDTVYDNLYWSDQVYEIFGVDKSIFKASFAAYNELLHPLDRDEVNRVVQEAYRTREPYSIYHRVVHPDNGAVKWVHSKGSVVVNNKGDVIQIMGTVLDVTELKERELVRDHLVSIIEHSTDAIVSISVDGIVISWNKTAEIMYGVSAEEVIGTNIFERSPTEKRKAEIASRIARVKLGEVVTVDDVGTHFITGVKFNQWVTYSPIRDIDNTITGISVIMRDMTERKEKEDSRFKLIVDSAPNVMLLVNQQGLMEIVNSQAEKMFGYRQDELLGQPIEILLPERFRDKHPGHRTGFFANPNARSMGAGRDLYALHKNGSEIPVEIGLNPIETPDGVIVLAAIIDITERKKMEEARREQEVVQETVRLKDQFMANMSHEIRTPMNAIVGFTDLLDRTDLKADQREYLAAIKSSGINLLTIVNDILDLSKIHSGKIQVERTPMSVTDIAQNICDIFGQKARDKGLALKYNEKPDKQVVVWGDPVRLSQILMNLISNALKFTEKGGIEVAIRLMEENKKQQTLAFRIKDTGIGIPENMMENIFDRFTQASSDTNRKYGGTGLGLSIVKGLIDIQGGEIVVESHPNEGSTFIFTLTFDKYVDPDQQLIKFNLPETSSLAVAPIAGLKILLVEDNHLNQKLATTVLTQSGCTVEIAENGEEALEKLNCTNYDVVLMDIQMPVMDGYRATQLIRNELKLQLPIIAMTAHAMAGERDKCLSLGMNDYLSKPFQRDQLIKIIQETVTKVV